MAAPKQTTRTRTPGVRAISFAAGGDHLDKLVNLGVIQFDGDRTVRMMADNRHAVGRPCPSVSLGLSVARRPGAFPSHW